MSINLRYILEYYNSLGVEITPEKIAEIKENLKI